MKTAHTSTTAIVASLLLSQADAKPLIPVFSRQVSQTAEIISELVKLFGTTADFAMKMFPSGKEAWNFEENGDLCEIDIESSYKGNGCWASVECADGGKKEYNNDHQDWNACYKDGEQHFTDDRIGDFSITFTEAGGDEGDGLTRPQIRLKDLGDKVIDVTPLAQKAHDDAECGEHKGTTCDDGPYVCEYFSAYTIHDDHTKKWRCGVPKRGKSFAGKEGEDGGLDSNVPTNEAGYAAGWCVVRTTQKKVDGGKPKIDVKVLDKNEAEIGKTDGEVEEKADVKSKLPLPVVVMSGGDAEKPINFEYDNNKWDSNSEDHHCATGKYDGDSRIITCGFTCN